MPLPVQRALGVLCACAATIACLPAGASAMTVGKDSTVSNDKFNVIEQSAETNVLTVKVNGTGNIEFRDTGALLTVNSLGCTQTGTTPADRVVSCSFVDTVPQVYVSSGLNDDTITFDTTTGSFTTQVDAGLGSDHVNGGGDEDVIFGYKTAPVDGTGAKAGDDNATDFINGGGGSDYLFGDGGDDQLNAADGVHDQVLNCGPGNDTLSDDAGLDPLPIACETINGGATDTTPPQTTINSAPSGTVTTGDATISFSSSESPSTFECRLTRGTTMVEDWTACTSPRSYTGLADGSYLFSVRATDASHNTDATPATASWTVSKPATQPTTTTTTTTTGGALSGTPAPSGTTVLPGLVGTGTPKNTVLKRKMPKVTGLQVAVARARVMNALKYADIDYDFDVREGCTEDRFGQVLIQSPRAGTVFTTGAGLPVPRVKLSVCFRTAPETQDCTDVSGLRDALRRLKITDAGVEILGAFAEQFDKCRQVYDVRIAKEKAAAAARAKSVKVVPRPGKQRAEIRSVIDCPRNPADQDLRIGLSEGASRGGTFGFRKNGPGGWTLPAESESYFKITVFDRAWQPVAADVYVDTADVVAPGFRSAFRTLDATGQIYNITPGRAGRIDICAVVDTGKRALFATAQIVVTKRLPVGEVWETVTGRKLVYTKNSANPTVLASSTHARAAGLPEVWQWVVGLFSGTSRKVNALDAESSTPQHKLSSAYATIVASPMQVQLCGGALAADPPPPVSVRGPAFYAYQGQVGEGTAPIMAAAGGGTCGSALLATTPISAAAARAAGLIGQDGSSIVAGGGGNIVAGGGGNVVAGGAGNIVGQDGTSVVAAGAGNVIAGGAGNIVATDGATIVATDGATIVAGGGGNAIAIDAAAMRRAGQANLLGDGGAGLIGQDGSSLLGRLP